MFKVMVTEKDGQASSYDFDTLKSEVSIGRVKGNDIVLPKGNVSKRHSRIVVKDGKFIVVDLKSTNGTFVNGRKIASPQVIKGEDKVYIGDFVLSIDKEANAEHGGPPLAPGAAPPSSSGVQPMGLSPSPLSAPSSPSFSPPPGPPPRVSAPAVAALDPLAPPPGGSLRSATTSSPAMGATAVSTTPIGSPSSPSLGAVKPANNGYQPRHTAPSAPSRPLGGPSPLGNTGGRLGASATPAMNPTSPGPESGGAMTAAGPAPMAPPAPMDIAPMPALTGMPSMQTPGAAAIVAKPRFVHQHDAAFAESSARAAEAFFGSVDPRELPAHYPPTEEDRARFDGAARDAATRAGANAEVAEHLLAEAVGLGPLERLLDDPSVEEIYVNSYDQLLFKQEGRVVMAPRAYSHPDFLYLAAQRLLAGRMDEPDAQMVEEVRFSDGTRVTITMPPLAPGGPALLVRKSRASLRSLQDLVAAGCLSAPIAQVLTQAVEAGRNILIAGPRGSGRVEMMNALAALIPDGVRIAQVESAPGLQLPQHSVMRLETSAAPGAGYDLQTLVQAALRMQPDRILLNAMSGAEAYDWMTAAAAGTYGSMALCHGISALDALGTVTSLGQLGAPSLHGQGLREQVARAVHLVVVMHTTSQGAPRLQQLAEVQGLDFNHYRVHDIFHFRAEGAGGQFVPTGYVPMFYEALRSAGVSVDNSVFNP